MLVIVIPCGEFANESERLAVETIRQFLQSQPGNNTWILLPNVAHNLNAARQSDEIDLIAIGPQDLAVIEIKHWDRADLTRLEGKVDAEADKLTEKVRRVATNSRSIWDQLPQVDGRFYLTKEKQAFGSQRPVSRDIKVF